MALATLALLAGGGALIDFLLSVLGAGGSILLLPLLVSGAALPTKQAVPLSLLVVMRPALAGSWIGGSWVKAGYIPEPVQLAVFAAAALVASWLLTRRADPRQAQGSPTATAASNQASGSAQGSRRHEPVLAAQGVLVGLLTGAEAVKRHQILSDPATGATSSLPGPASRHRPS